MIDLLRRTYIGFRWAAQEAQPARGLMWASLFMTTVLLIYNPFLGVPLVFYDVYLFQGTCYRDYVRRTYKRDNGG